MKAVLVDVYLPVFLYYTSIADIGYSYVLWSLVTNIKVFVCPRLSCLFSLVSATGGCRAACHQVSSVLNCNSLCTRAEVCVS